MNETPYAMIYHDKQCQTLNEAIRKMNAISNPIFCYQHTIYANNTNSDLAYAPYITHDILNEVITVRFPKECKWIANMRNNHKCKMVMYYKDMQTYLNQAIYFKEITIDSSMNIDTRAEHDVKIIIYTRGNKNLEIYFDMHLVKPIKCKL